MYDVLLCESERESDFDIFGCMSECETIRLVISLVCLICNISLLHETRRLVANPCGLDALAPLGDQVQE